VATTSRTMMKMGMADEDWNSVLVSDSDSGGIQSRDAHLTAQAECTQTMAMRMKGADGSGVTPKAKATSRYMAIELWIKDIYWVHRAAGKSGPWPEDRGPPPFRSFKMPWIPMNFVGIFIKLPIWQLTELIKVAGQLRGWLNISLDFCVN